MYSYVNIGNARHTGRCATHGSLVSGRNELSSAICLATASHSSPLFSLIFIAYSSLQLVSWWPPKTNDFGHDVGHVFERIPGLLSTSFALVARARGAALHAVQRVAAPGRQIRSWFPVASDRSVRVAMPDGSVRFASSTPVWIGAVPRGGSLEV